MLDKLDINHAPNRRMGMDCLGCRARVWVQAYRYARARGWRWPG